jgi:hypothetical protein
MPKYIILYRDKRTPHLPSRVLTDKDGIMKTFESEEDAKTEAAVLALKKGVSHVEVEKQEEQDQGDLIKAVEGAKRKVKEAFTCPVCGRHAKREK